LNILADSTYSDLIVIHVGEEEFCAGKIQLKHWSTVDLFYKYFNLGYNPELEQVPTFQNYTK
jgi:hypothetical protein